MYDILSKAWQTKTNFERYEQTWIAPQVNRPVSNQNGYEHQPYESGDSRHFASDTHPEDTWS